MKDKKKPTKKKVADDLNKEVSIQKIKESVPEETEESTEDKSVIPDKKTHEVGLREKEDKSTSESNSSEENGGEEVEVEIPVTDKKLDKAAEEK